MDFVIAKPYTVGSAAVGAERDPTPLLTRNDSEEAP